MNRSQRRLQARNTGRCNSKGIPMFASLATKADRETFKKVRSNKKLMSYIKTISKNGMTYTKSGMKEANKVLNNPEKYSSKDVKKAGRMIDRLGQYNLICLDDVYMKFQKLQKA